MFGSLVTGLTLYQWSFSLCIHDAWVCPKTRSSWISKETLTYPSTLPHYLVLFSHGGRPNPQVHREETIAALPINTQHPASEGSEEPQQAPRLTDDL